MDGSFNCSFGLSIGATLLYIFANFFLKELIKEKFLNKYQRFEIKFKKSEFVFLLVYQVYSRHPVCNCKCVAMYI